MSFDSKEIFNLFLRNLKEIGIGSQGVCYLDKKNKVVYKVFHQYFDPAEESYMDYDYKMEEVLQFSNISNNTFVWPKDVIIVENKIVGYISSYVDAKPLDSVNPLNVSLNKILISSKKVINDIEIISENGIVTYDMMYNVLYGRKGIFVIDTDDYVYSSKDREKIFKTNRENFNRTMMYFLVDNYFNKFVSSNINLKEMYSSSDINIEEFILYFQKSLSEYVGEEITKLREASSCLNKYSSISPKYLRRIVK